MSTTARRAALESLLRCEKDQKFSNLELSAAIAHHGLEGKEKGLFTTLLYGVIERKTTLDYLISQYSDRPIEKLDAVVRCILRLGLYQILFLDRIPDSAACNESVGLTKEKKVRSAAPFVNAVLRKAVRQKNTIVYPDKETEPLLYLSVYYAFPLSLCEVFLHRFGFARTAQLFEAFNRPAPLTLRVNTLRITREDLLTLLPQAKPSALIDTAVLLPAATPISELAPLHDGLCFVQDQASQLCARLLDAKAGHAVLDMCACPGGKSFSLAMDMQNTGTLLSCDLHQSKLHAVQSGSEKLGITILSCKTQNGREFVPAWEKAFDRVLCDVPCSGFGVIGKKPDLRHKEIGDIARLPEIQYEILQNGARYVKDGGILVYSTCTVISQENEDVVHAFLQANPHFILEEMRTLYPDTDATDGFFMAKFKKRKG